MNIYIIQKSMFVKMYINMYFHVVLTLYQSNVPLKSLLALYPE